MQQSRPWRRKTQTVVENYKKDSFFLLSVRLPEQPVYTDCSLKSMCVVAYALSTRGRLSDRAFSTRSLKPAGSCGEGRINARFYNFIALLRAPLHWLP